MSPALSRALELVRERPLITSAEIALELGVSPSYARTLLRRAHDRTSLAVVPRPALAAGLEPEIARLTERVEALETALTAVRSTPLQARASWNFNRRSEVVRLASDGASSTDIAAALNVCGGEVDFILKVDRYLSGE